MYREPISKRDKQNEKLGNKRKLEKVRNKELRDQEIRDEGVWSIIVSVKDVFSALFFSLSETIPELM